MTGPRFEQTDFDLQVRDKSVSKHYVGEAVTANTSQPCLAPTLLGDGTGPQAAGALDA